MFPVITQMKSSQFLIWKYILDEKNQILHDFYEKDTKNDNVILASSALNWHQKRNIMVNEALRRLRNTSSDLSPEVQNSHLSDFMCKLKNLGYIY